MDRRALEAGLAAHREAAEEFAAAALATPGEAWCRECAPGKWSPAQIAEHMNLAYEAHLAELRGGPGLRIRVKGLRRLLLRLTVLPRLLRTGRFPVPARSPRELAPHDPGTDLAGAVARFRTLASEFEAEIGARLAEGNGVLTHPFFGRLTGMQGLRFVELHVRHHRRQFPGAREELAGA